MAIQRRLSSDQAWRLQDVSTGFQVDGARALRNPRRRGGCVAISLTGNRNGTMRTHTKNRRRAQLCVESLEGKMLLSAGSVMHQVAHHAAPIVAQAAFSGTLTGRYSDVHAPFFADIQSYTASGTLSGIGSTTHLPARCLCVRARMQAGWSGSSPCTTTVAR
jgi:hypothetical protein